MKKRWKVLLWILGILLVIDLGAGYYFFQVAEVRAPKNFIAKQTALNKKDPLYKEKMWYQNVKKEDWTIKSDDGLKLKAYYILAQHQTNKTIVMAHGFMNSKEYEGGPAGMFHELGYNVLIPDDRAHGKSEGKIIGYGWLDRKDYLNWIKTVLAKKGTNQQIGMYGVSMGGATTMMLSGEKDVPKQVKAYIEDCGYTSVDDEVTYQAKQLYNLPKYPLVPTVSLISKIKAGYSYPEASAVKQLKNNKTPMLFIHGQKDTFVPTKMVDQLYDATNGPKEKLIVNNAAHAKSQETNYPQYKDKVQRFLTKYM